MFKQKLEKLPEDVEATLPNEVKIVRLFYFKKVVNKEQEDSI